MDRAKRMYEHPTVKARIKQEAGTASRFAVVGAIATLVHSAVALGLFSFGLLSAFPANVVGFLCAFSVSFAGHHIWSFGASRGTQATHRRMRRFFILALAGFLANSSVLTAWLALTPWPDGLGILFSIAVVPGLSFLGARFWAFSAKNSKPAGSK